jgi:acyl-CoA synthetase (AMP-forming)/AMP-acid ligase II
MRGYVDAWTVSSGYALATHPGAPWCCRAPYDRRASTSDGTVLATVIEVASDTGGWCQPPVESDVSLLDRPSAENVFMRSSRALFTVVAAAGAVSLIAAAVLAIADDFDAGSVGWVFGGPAPFYAAGLSPTVAVYKYPRMVWIVDTLPKGLTGKILKREIVPPAVPGKR